MQVNIRQMKIKNFPEYLFNDNMIVNIKDFRNKTKNHLRVFLVLIFTTLNTLLKNVLII